MAKGYKQGLSAEFGVVVRRYRNRLDLSQEKFSEKANIHRTYVSAIELGKVDIGLNVAGRLAKALGKPLNTLVREAEKA